MKKKIYLLLPLLFIFAGSVRSQEYHTGDIEALKNFLTQESAEPGKKNWEQFTWQEPEWDTDQKWQEKVKTKWTSIRPKRLTEVYWFDRKLAGELDLSSCEYLEQLNCNGNKITYLNVANLSQLTKLYCNVNQLTSLDLTGLTNLKLFDSYVNPISYLDFSDLRSIEILNCSSNELTSIELPNSPNLEWLNMYGNQINTLDVRACPSLKELMCGDNPLNSLLVSGLNYLEFMDCGNSALSVLDLSGLTALKKLDCRYSNLTILDLSGLSSLESANCMDNQLAYLDVSNLSNLTELYCSNNKLSLQELPAVLPQYTTYLYSPQEKNDIIDVTKDGVIDLTSYLRDNKTVFKWYSGENSTNELTDIPNNNGIFTIPNSYNGQWLLCKITNDGFPEFDNDPFLYRVKLETETPPVEATYYTLTVPTIEGIEINPLPGVHRIKENTTSTIEIRSLDGYSVSDMTVRLNGEIIEPVSGSNNNPDILLFDLGMMTNDMVIEIEDVKKTDVVAVEKIAESAHVYTQEKHLCIDTPVSNELSVYTINGSLVIRQKIQPGIKTILLPPGIYLVVLKEETHKISIP